MKYASVAAFLATILLANYVTTEYGMVPVGFGLVATAGTYLAGLSFILRDLLHDTIRASLPNRLVFVEQVTEFNGRLFSLGIRRESVPPRDRDVVVRVLLVILAGAVLSFAVSAPFIAVASACAFLLSEVADLLVYSPLRRRGYLRAAVASNVVGAVVDSAVFLTISGFGMAGMPGQVVGKVTVTAAAVLLVLAYRARRSVVAA
jgi:uncharacterized PurR-regulated membrane protein YhhQ (DUF165 family)